jgi:molybdopterin synthase sulfur carrier subunit
MPRLRFTPHLRRFFPGLAECDLPASTVAETIRALDQLHPGLAGYLIDDQGSLRRHVNVFVRGELVRDRVRLTDATGPDDEVFILQALSGG